MLTLSKFLPVLMFTMYFAINVGIASESESKHRPFTEMEGDCDAFGAELKNALTLWENKSQSLQSASSAKGAPPIVLDQKIALDLHNANVRFPVRPAKKFPGATSFGGIATFVPSASGEYRVSLGGKVWLDVVDLEKRKAVKADSFEMQTKCSKIFKTVTFQLEKNQRYAVQLSSSPKKIASLLISAP